MTTTTQTWEIGDCLDLLPEIEDESIDCILTDLPYGTTNCAWDTIIPFEPLWEQYKRITKDNATVVLTASQPFTSALIMSNIEMFKYCWIWSKERASNFFAAKFQPLNNTEDVIIFSNGGCNNGSINPMRYNPQDVKKCNIHCENGANVDGLIGKAHKTNMIKGKKYIQTTTSYPYKTLKFNRDVNVSHPTQKPVALFEYLIKTYTNEGELVHDSCLGSGTTLEACKNTNRNCIGFELSDEWVPHYKQRLNPNKYSSVKVNDKHEFTEYESGLKYFR